MFFANPWGLLGLLSLPIIAAIHLFQRRFPQLDVAGLHLWDLDIKVKKAGRRVDRLPISRTLLLELFCGLLLTILLAQPRVSSTSAINRWIVVLDNSASMAALTPQGTFRDLAIKQIEEQIEGQNNLQVTVILTGRRPAIIAGPRVTWRDARAKLADWKPSDTQHDYQIAWDMAAELTGPNDSLLFVTDRMVDTSITPAQMTVAAVGQPLVNLCFESARWTRDEPDEPSRLYVRLANKSEEPILGDLVARSAGQEIFRQAIEFKPRSAIPFETELPDGLNEIELAIESEVDALKTDSIITLVQPKSRTIAYALELPENHPAISYTHRVMNSMNNVEQADDTDSANFLIGDINQPVIDPQIKTWIGIGPVDPNLPSASPDTDDSAENTADQNSENPEDSGNPENTEDTNQSATEEDQPPTYSVMASRGPFLIDRRNSVLEGITLEGVYWSGILTIADSTGSLVSTGDRILLGERSDLERTWYYMNIDLAKSNLLTSQDWPILISNIVENSRKRLPGLRNWNYKIGEQVEFLLSQEDYQRAPARSLTLEQMTALGAPASDRTIARLPSVEIPPPAEAGLYEIKDGNQVIDRFAVNFFDADESNLQSLDSGFKEGVATEYTDESHEKNLTWLWWLLLLVAGLAVIGDWLVLRPRKGEA